MGLAALGLLVVALVRFAFPGRGLWETATLALGGIYIVITEVLRVRQLVSERRVKKRRQGIVSCVMCDLAMHLDSDIGTIVKAMKHVYDFIHRKANVTVYKLRFIS